MFGKVVFFFLVTLTALVTCASHQSISNYGSEFNIGILRQYTASDNIKMTVVTESASTVSFSISSLTSSIYNGTINSASSITVSLSTTYQVRESSYSYRQLGLHVTSTHPISITIASYVSGITIPVSTYLALPYYELQPIEEYVYYGVSENTDNGFRSQILLVGCRDNTTVTITPTQNVQLPQDPQNSTSPLITITSGTSHTITLHLLQTLLISVVNSDLGGTKIVSNYLLTVIGGHDCAKVPSTYDSCTPLSTQIPPTINWGTDYLLTPFQTRTNGQRYKIISSENNTTLTIKCPTLSRNDELLSIPGTVYTFEQTTAQEYCSCVCSKPCYIAQVAYSGDYPNRNGHGGPLLMTVPPISQYSHNVTFTTLPDTTSILYNVAVPADSYYNSMIIVNGNIVAPTWTPINSTSGTVIGYGYSSMTNGDTTISHSHSNGKVYVSAYGFDRYVGYGYLTGSNLDPLLYITFNSSNFYINEDSGSVTVYMSRSNRLLATVSVFVRTSKSTNSPANEYSDYTPINQTVTFNPQESLKSVTIPILEDEFSEPTEHFLVSIEVLVNGVVYQVDQTRVSIYDDDDITFGLKETLIETMNEERVSVSVIQHSGTLQPGLAVVLALEIRETTGNTVNVSTLYFQYGVSEVAIIFNATQLSLSFNMSAQILIDENRSSQVRAILTPNQATIRFIPPLSTSAITSSSTISTSTTDLAITPSTITVTSNIAQPTLTSLPSSSFPSSSSSSSLVSQSPSASNECLMHSSASIIIALQSCLLIMISVTVVAIEYI